MWFVQAMAQARERQCFRLWAWVIMPEHVHLLLHPQTENYSISRILQSIRGPFACRLLADWRKRSRHRLSRVRVGSGATNELRFWQEGGGLERNLFQMPPVVVSGDSPDTYVAKAAATRVA